MTITIFTTTSPVFWYPSQWRLSSTAVISSKIFLAVSQNSLNFVFCIVYSQVPRFVCIFYDYFNSFIILCQLIIFWSVINWNWAGDILLNMTCSVNLHTFYLCKREKYFGKFCITFSIVEFGFVKWSTEIGSSCQTKSYHPWLLYSTGKIK